jgi:hypothetical protein
MKVGRDSPVIMVRVPDELKCWLKQEAEKNRRSLNGELLVRLEESRSQQVKDAKP